MRPDKRLSILLTCCLSALLCFGGIAFYSSEARNIRDEKYALISAVAHLKSSQIANWRQEQIKDAWSVSTSPYLLATTEKLLTNKNNLTLRNEFTTRLKEINSHYGYANIVIASAQGRAIADADSCIDCSDSILVNTIRNAMTNRAIELTNFYRSRKTDIVHFDVIAPIYNAAHIAIAVLVFRLAPYDYIYPLIQEWPVPSKSSETLLSRRDGDSVVFLNELRHRKNTTLRFKIPLSRIDVPSVKAALGYTGLFEGTDYRGVPVIAFIEKVPNSPWNMISKIDRAEIFKDLNIRAVYTGIFTAFLILLLWVGLALFYNMRQKSLYANLFIKEKELRQSQEEFKTTLYSIGDGVITTDKSGYIRHMNRVAERLTGYRESDANGKPLDRIFKIINETTLETVVNPVEKVLREGIVVGLANHTLLISKDGTQTPIADSGAPIKNDQNETTGVVLIFQDQTEERKRQNALQESEQRYRSLFTEMQEGFALHEIVCDADGKPIDYRFLDSNPAFEKITGLPSSTTIGKTVKQLMPDIEQSWIDRYGDVALNGSAVAFENFAQPLDKHFHVMAFCPQKGKFAVLFTDISDRKKSELLLAQEKERLRITLRSIGDGVITTDVHGNVIMLNKSAEALTGWKTEDACGKKLAEVFTIIHDQTRQACEDPVAKVLKTGSIVELANHTCLIAKDGREIIIADSGAPIRDNESRIIGVVLVFRDITDKQRLADSLQQRQKLESLGVLAGGIAHDFNNLLSGIFGFIEMAKDSISDNNPELAQKQLTKAFGAFERAKSLTQQLLTFSKGGTPVCKTISLGPLILNSTRFVLSGSSVTNHVAIAEDLWHCDCDENQIGQVIDNIVINANQAMPLGGKISVSADNIHFPVLPGSDPEKTGNFIKISIADQGIGMPKEIVSRIFDPFFSTKQTGHGLGLATVFSIVKKHNGWIDVESEPGKGSTFHVYLPASVHVAAGITEKSEYHSGRGTVLVMDDEDFMRELFKTCLEGFGYSVLKAENGDAALEIFTKHTSSIKLCILDLTIPGGMGGKDTAVALKKLNANAMLVAASGYSEDPVMADPHAHGFADKITKPFRKNELAALLTRLFPELPNG